MLVEVTNLQERGGEVVVLLSISLTTTIMGQKTEIRGGSEGVGAAGGYGTEEVGGVGGGLE